MAVALFPYNFIYKIRELEFDDVCSLLKILYFKKLKIRI